MSKNEKCCQKLHQFLTAYLSGLYREPWKGDIRRARRACPLAKVNFVELARLDSQKLSKYKKLHLTYLSIKANTSFALGVISVPSLGLFHQTQDFCFPDVFRLEVQGRQVGGIVHVSNDAVRVVVFPPKRNCRLSKP